jgi:hypothetical protein
MIIKDNLCYSLLLEMLLHPQFHHAVFKTEFTKPKFEHEGIAGYIETEVTFHVTDLPRFSGIYSSAFSTPYEIKRGRLPK